MIILILLQFNLAIAWFPMRDSIDPESAVQGNKSAFSTPLNSNSAPSFDHFNFKRDNSGFVNALAKRGPLSQGFR